MAKQTLKNNSTLEITGNPRVMVKSEIIDSGEPKERKRFTIIGRTQLNKPTVIGTLKLTASENKRFLKAPSINKASNRNVKLNSNLKLSLVSVERNTDNNITEYLYNLVYTAKESVSKLNKLNYTIENKTVKKVTEVTGINSVHCGRSIINKNGEVRNIKIFGTPGTAFKVAFVKNQMIRDAFVSGGRKNDGHKGRVTSLIQTDMLNSRYANGTILDGEFTIIDGKLNSRGEYSFWQSFPKVTDSDISTNGLGTYTFYILPSSIKSKLKLLFLNGSGGLEFGRWDGWFSKIFEQQYTPKLTLRATTNSVLYTINNMVIPDGASSQTYDRIFRSKRSRKTNKVEYQLRAISTSHSFSALKTPTFGGGSSDWTNTDPTSNGGLYTKFRNLSVTISTTTWTNDTCVISFNIDTRKWGTQDVVMATALNTLVGCS